MGSLERVKMIRKATLEDLDKIKELADSEVNAVGFTLRPALVESIHKNSVFVAVNDNDIIGYVAHRKKRDLTITLSTIVVCKKERGNSIGKQLIQTLIDEAITLDMKYILLKCPVELPSNNFYKALGFKLVRTDPGKKRQLNVWQYITKEYLI